MGDEGDSDGDVGEMPLKKRGEMEQRGRSSQRRREESRGFGDSNDDEIRLTF